MKIINLKSENVKKLVAVEIDAAGNLIVIGGKNGQGKSSVLDSIAMAIGGTKLCPKEPIRHGQKEAKINIEIDDDKDGKIIVTRTFTNNGSYLTVKNGEGMKFQSPQKILDDLFGRLSFDPLAFSTMRPADQVATLRDLAGVDTTKIDDDIQTAFDKRTDANRETKRLEPLAADLPHYDDVPDERINLQDIMAEKDEAQRLHEQRREKINGLNDELREINSQENQIVLRGEKIKDLEQQIEDEKAEIKALAIVVSGNKTKVEEVRAEIISDDKNLPDMTQFNAKIEAAEETNAKIEANKLHTGACSELDDHNEIASQLTLNIDNLRTKREQMITAATMPIDGLGFGQSGVTYNNIPFEQCSSAEQLRVSVSMGLAMNPKLRVLLIRDGSLLDEDNLKLISDMATDADAQIWIERVGSGDECSVIMEDGSVQEQPIKEPVDV